MIKTTRRTILKAAGFGASALAMPSVWTSAQAQGKKIVVRDDGGIYTRAYDAVFYKPFTEATGIEVIPVQASADPTAQIRSMVDTGTYTWDMAKISLFAISVLTQGEKPYLDKHGLEAEAPISSIPKQYMSEYGVGTNIWSTILAYRTDVFEGKPKPASWKDFYDLEKFPRRRAVRKHPFDTIENALLAAGVPSDQIYPCDFDKAYAQLDKIKSGVDIWWTSGAQVEQLLGSGEVDMVATWVSRAQGAQAAGVPVEIIWDQNIWSVDSWTILSGTPNADACREFIKFASDPKRQAGLVKFFAAGVTQPEAFSLMDPNAAASSPSFEKNIASGIKVDSAFWVNNQVAALERFNGWLLK